ncbi:MAG: NAD(P)/FAD-dependent oxidoreductase [Propionibacteriaceae bacterium]|jgi:2,4-dienoyl-CoA reductase (NADPH2)|nr:NAD(P)/FAD-dependent oxidoreductase [Propionibacteriaceae bacterium]
MGQQFPILSSPIQVGGVKLRNRMLTTSMSPGAGYVDEEFRPTQRFLNYLEERAAGQTALITQTIAPLKRTKEHPGLSPLPGGWDDDCIEHLQKMAEVVHRHGGLIAGQPYFVHDWKTKVDEDEKPWGPSDISILKFMGPFTAMTLEHIALFKQHFLNCARVIKESGWDAIEVMAGVGGILNRFLSPATNNRTDQYGGSLENRVRLACEVISELRAMVGPDYPILVRWSPVEFVKSPNGEGHTITEALKVVPYLEEAGADLHNLAVGWHETSVPLTIKTIPDGHWSWISNRIKAVAKKPVVTAYRETDPYVMEKILAEGKADVIGGLRYSIADPAFPRKVVEDRPDEIAMCICCCRCLDDVVSKELPLTKCGVNARLGAELDYKAPPKADKPKTVLVAGSGPAGLVAALTAASRGHDVTIAEAGPRIGGSVKMSSIFSPLHERLLKYYKKQLELHPEVKIRLNTPVTPAFVDSFLPDAVIVAIGGEPKGIDVPGVDGPNVVTSHDFLEMLNGRVVKKKGLFNAVAWRAGAVFLKLYYTPTLGREMAKRSPWPLGKSVAIIGGGLPGCELGELTMHSGRQTAIIEEGKKVGYDVGASDRFHVTSAFKKSEYVDLYPATKVDEITGSGVLATQQTPEGPKEVVINAKTVAVTLGFQPNPGLAEALKQKGIPVWTVGDCDDPGRIADATKAGYQAGVEV